VHGEYLFRAEFFFHGGQMMLQSLWTGMVSFEQLGKKAQLALGPETDSNIAFF
jgi:hypothetical protein